MNKLAEHYSWQHSCRWAEGGFLIIVAKWLKYSFYDCHILTSTLHRGLFLEAPFNCEKLTIWCVISSTIQGLMTGSGLKSPAVIHVKIDVNLSNRVLILFWNFPTAEMFSHNRIWCRLNSILSCTRWWLWWWNINLTFVNRIRGKKWISSPA